MTEEEMAAIRRDLDRFLKKFDGCIRTRPSREHLRTYVGGQVGRLPRKSIEPIALEAGVPPRSLQEFLGLHKWDEQAVRRRLQQVVATEHASPEAVAVIDESSFPKKGDETAGVQRQYCGATGKTDNCVVTVHLGYATEDFYALIDGDLYLPEETWARDADRRSKAGIPEDLVFREKWRIALDLLDRAVANGVTFRYLTADEGYGRSGAFRRGVAAHGIQYVVEVPCSTSGWTRRPPTTGPEDYAGIGRPRVRRALSPDARPARRADELWRRGGPKSRRYHVKDTDKGPVVWEARAGRFCPWEDGLPGEEGWLIVARNALDGEVKYFFSNAPEGTPLTTLLRIAFRRWIIERLFEDGKSEIGMGHFEVRRYIAILRHLVVSLVSLLFLVTETNRLRGEKSLVERVAGGGSAGRAA